MLTLKAMCFPQATQGNLQLPFPAPNPPPPHTHIPGERPLGSRVIDRWVRAQDLYSHPHDLWKQNPCPSAGG